MPIDLNDLDRVKSAWLPMTGQLSGVEFLIKCSTPRDAERFRQRLVRLNVMKDSKAGWQINANRQDDFFKLFAEFYVLDWRGDIKPDGSTYNPEQMGRILGASTSAFEQVSSAISEDEDFFAPTNGES